MYKLRKAAALFLAVFVLTVMFLAHDMVTLNANHHCTGEDCSVCTLVNTVLKNLSGVNCICTGVWSVVFFCVFTQFYLLFKKYISVRNTLVLLNVELLN